MTYQTKVRRDQGGDRLAVAQGGSIDMQGGAITANGTQAAAIPDVAGGSTIDAEARVALNALLAAARGAGIIAS